MIKNKVIVLDVSFWQDVDTTPYKIDFRRAWSNGADGVILRAGQNAWVDEDYLDYARNADAAGFPRGAYWFFDSRVSPIPQADLFADIVEMSGFPQLGIWGDYEEHYNGGYGGETNFKLFMEQLQKRFPGKLVGVYTGPAYWRENTTPTGRVQFAEFPLWIANYGVLEPAIPAPWVKDEWLFWQFTDSGDGQAFGAESKDIDMNFFNGSLEEYKNKFNLGGYEPAPEPEQGDKMYKCNVRSDITPYANLRATPNGLDLGDVNLYPNEEFTADRIEKDTMARDWLHCVKPGKEGYVLASLCQYSAIPETPTGDKHVVEVFIDGVLEFRKEF